MYGLNQNVIGSVHDTLSHFSQIEEVILYGSRAKGNFRKGSNIDLCLKGNGLDLDLLCRLSNEIDELLFPYIFDISIYNQIHQEDLLDHIDRIGVVFYKKT
jgi:predicted nucleotidyltransferase